MISTLFLCLALNASLFLEQSLRQSRGLDEGVFSTLDKMESLQNKRAQRWGDKMDRYTNDRELLAQQLTSCFENLEQETGIFLIKPVYSLKGRYDLHETNILRPTFMLLFCVSCVDWNASFCVFFRTALILCKMNVINCKVHISAERQQIVNWSIFIR